MDRNVNITPETLNLLEDRLGKTLEGLDEAKTFEQSHGGFNVPWPFSSSGFSMPSSENPLAGVTAHPRHPWLLCTFLILAHLLARPEAQLGPLPTCTPGLEHSWRNHTAVQGGKEPACRGHAQRSCMVTACRPSPTCHSRLCLFFEYPTPPLSSHCYLRLSFLYTGETRSRAARVFPLSLFSPVSLPPPFP